MLHSFRARLFAGFGIVIGLTLFLSASAFVLLLREQQQESVEQRIGSLVGPLSESVREMETLGWPTQMMRPPLVNVARAYNIRILVLDGAGRVILDTAPGESMLGDEVSLAQATVAPAPGDGRMDTFRTQRISARGDELYLFTAGESPNNVRNARSRPSSTTRLVVAVPAGDVTAAWAQLLPRLGLAGLAAGLLAAVFASLMAARFTTPIAQITRASEAMARGDLNQRIDVDGEDEVGRLAQAFNHMSSQVSRSNRAMHDLLANVSHELRTPLTSIQGFSQALLDGLPGDPKETGAVIHDEADRIRLLVDDLLYLSEIESGALRLELHEVDIDAILGGAVTRFRFQAEEARVELRTALGGAVVTADGRRIEQVIANLLDNAIRFAPAESAVTLSSRRVAGGALVEVHNAGATVPADQLDRLFDRFYQADPARSGGRHRGLGLSIVQELVQAHGGTVAIESTAERGTTVSVFLPAGGPAAEAPRAEPFKGEQGHKEEHP